MSERRSPWMATVSPSHRQSLEASIDADVVVVGSGITGLTTALLLQRRGVRVVVVEADRIGHGTTGHTTGKATSQHGLLYHRLIERHGEVKAQLYAEANQSAIGTIASLADVMDTDCSFTRAPSFLYATNESEVERLRTEHDAAIRVGLPATLTTTTDLPMPVALALRFEEQAYFHPGHYIEGLARQVEAEGATIFEQSRVVSIDERDDTVVASTAGGSVRARSAVLATLLPPGLVGGYFAVAKASRAYGIAARLNSGGLEGMHLHPDSPTRSTRPWNDGDRPGIIVVGENHDTGSRRAAPGRWGELERWARQHFDIASFDYRWSAQDFMPVDYVPFVGRARGRSRTYVATGFQKWGLTNGTAAATVLADLVGEDVEHPWLELYDATRLGGIATVARLAEYQARAGAEFVTGHLARIRAKDVGNLAPGQGGVAMVEGSTVGAYRRPDGGLDAVSPTCPHMGCALRWNGAENSWDCPCHGSRFSSTGVVLDGPSTGPLQRKDVGQPPAGQGDQSAS